MVTSQVFRVRRIPPSPARRFTPGAPVGTVLAPLAWALAAVEAAVRRPSLVVAATVLLVCLPRELQNLDPAGRVTTVDLAAAALVAVVAIRVFGGDRIAAPRRGWLPFALVVGSFALTTVAATEISESMLGFVRYTEVFVLVPVAVAMAIRDRRDVLLVAGAVVITAVFQGSVGVWQYVTGTGASYAGDYVRAVGTFGAENIMAIAVLVGYGILVTLALGLALRGRARVFLVGTAALLVLPLTLALSRGAWIATACAVLVMLVIFSWRIAAVAVGLVAVTVAVAVMAMGGAGSGSSGTIDQRLASIGSSASAPDRSVQDRYALWHTAVDIWTDHPVVGVGLRDFVSYRDTYAPVSLSAGSDVDDPALGFRREPLQSPHNMYLMVLSEQGTVGAVGFGGLLVTLTWGALRRRCAPPPRDRFREGVFFDLVAPAVMVWTLVSFVYGDIGGSPTAVVLAVLLGLAARRGVIAPRTAALRNHREEAP